MAFRRYTQEDYRKAKEESERKPGDWAFINYKNPYVVKTGLNYIRIVPTHDDDEYANSPFGMWVFYHIIKGATFTYKLCPWTFKEPCPWCEESQRLSNANEDNDDFYARKRLIMFVLDCNEGSDMGKLKVWAAPKTIERKLWDAIEEGIDDEIKRGEIIPVEDPIEGRVISFRVSYQEKMPQYESLRIRNKLPLDSSIEDILPRFKDIIVPSTYEELQTALSGITTRPHVSTSPKETNIEVMEETPKEEYEEYEDKLAARIKEMQRKIRAEE